MSENEIKLVTAKKICRVAIYARFSTDNQNPESANDQIAKTLQYIAENKIKPRIFELDQYELVPDARWIKKDEAKSGRSERDGYEQIKEGIRRKAFDILLVDDLSRLTRQLGGLLDLYDLLKFHGVELISLSDLLSSADPQSRMNFIFKGIVNEGENDAHIHKTKRGLEQKKRNGFSTGDVCYGYRSKPTKWIKKGGRDTPTDFRVEIFSEEAQVVNDIFDLYLSGKGFDSISHHLNEKKIQTSRRAQARTGNPYNWSHTSVRKILSNPKYIGIWAWGKFRIAVNPETNEKVRFARPEEDWIHHNGLKDAVDDNLVIISQEKWHSVQQQLNERTKKFDSTGDRAAGMRKAKNVGANCQAILSSVLCCYVCGGPLYQESGKKSGYYGCHDSYRKGESECVNRKLLPRSKVDFSVVEKLKEVLLDPNTLTKATEAFNQIIRERLKVAPSRTINLKDRLARVESEINNLLRFIMDSPTSISNSTRQLLTAKEDEKKVIIEELRIVKEAGEDKVFITPLALRAKLEKLQEYLYKDAEIANVILKMLFPKGLVAQPLIELGKANRYNTKWILTGELLVLPSYEFDDLKYGGR